MIELVEDCYLWEPGEQTFYRVESDLTLIDLPPQRVDVTRQRVAQGWALIASHPFEENARLFISDVWSRIVDT